MPALAAALSHESAQGMPLRRLSLPPPSRLGLVRPLGARCGETKRGALRIRTMSRASNFLSKRRRRAIYQRDAYRCQWCDTELTTEQLSLDHFIPESVGGNHCNANLFTSCKRHNSARGNLSVFDYACRLSEPLPGVPMGPIVIRILRAVSLSVPAYRKPKRSAGAGS